MGNRSQEGVRKRLLLPQCICGPMLASSCAVLSILKVAMKSLGVKRLGTYTFASPCFVDSGLFIPCLPSLKSAGVLPSTLTGARLRPLMLRSRLCPSEQESNNRNQPQSGLRNASCCLPAGRCRRRVKYSWLALKLPDSSIHVQKINLNCVFCCWQRKSA